MPKKKRKCSHSDSIRNLTAHKRDHKDVPNVPLNVLPSVKTRFALPLIPNPQDGDAVEVEIYREYWLFYNGAWHGIAGDEESVKSPYRPDLLVKCLAWGP